MGENKAWQQLMEDGEESNFKEREENWTKAKSLHLNPSQKDYSLIKQLRYET